MQLGIPWWRGAGAPEAGLQAASDHGFDLLELSLDAPWPQSLEAETIAATCDSLDVELGLHGPWRTQALAHPRAGLAQAAADVVRSCLAWGRRAGAAYLVLHVDARAFSGYPDRGVVEQGLSHAQENLRALADGAGPIDLIVENTTTPMGTPQELTGFLSELPGIKFCFDPGHALLSEAAGAQGASGDPSTWADHLGDRLALVHAMDHIHADGRVIDHLVPGIGEADLTTLVDLCDQAGCERIVLEAFYKDRHGTPATVEDLVRGGQALEDAGLARL